MASFFRSLSTKSRPLFQKTLKSKPLFSSPLPSPTKSIHSASRVVSALGCVESLMPLHSAVASARLTSNIAVNTSCWSWLSQGLAVPL